MLEKGCAVERKKTQDFQHYKGKEGDDIKVLKVVVFKWLY